MGRSDTGVSAGWTEGKPWEIAGVAKERYGRDDRVDGGETVQNSSGTAWFPCWSCSCTVSSTAEVPEIKLLLATPMAVKDGEAPKLRREAQKLHPKIEPLLAANSHASAGRRSSKIAPNHCQSA